MKQPEKLNLLIQVRWMLTCCWDVDQRRDDAASKGVPGDCPGVGRGREGSVGGRPGHHLICGAAAAADLPDAAPAPAPEGGSELRDGRGPGMVEVEAATGAKGGGDKTRKGGGGSRTRTRETHFFFFNQLLLLFPQFSIFFYGLKKY